MYSPWSGVAVSRCDPCCASHVSAAWRSLPRSRKLAFRPSRSHSVARTSRRACASSHSRSVSIASIRSSTECSKSSASRKKIQFGASSSARTFVPSSSRRRIGIRRLFWRTAWSSSSPQTSELAKSGLSTASTVRADSTPASILARQSAVLRMSSQSTQTSLSRASSAATSRWTNSWSLREYETKTSGRSGFGAASGSRVGDSVVAVRAAELQEQPALRLQALGRLAVMPPPLSVVEELLDGGAHRDDEAHDPRGDARRDVERRRGGIDGDERGHEHRADDRRQPEREVALAGRVRLVLEPRDLVEPSRPEEALLRRLQVNLVDQAAG